MSGELGATSSSAQLAESKSLNDHANDQASYPAVDESYESVPEDQLIAPTNFRPFFTLVEDATTGEHFHPHVHYIFADDDPDTLTNSVMDNIQAEADENHRLLLVDVGSDGRAVTSAHSLSSAWQVTQTSLVPAPSWTEAGPEAASESLMLKVEGAAIPIPASKEKQQGEAQDTAKRMETDIEAYNEHLEHLQNILAKSSVL